MSERHCLKCVYCDFYGGSPGYSEMTPGSPMEFKCAKKAWNADDAGDRRGLAEFMERAKDCRHYKEEQKP